MSISNNVLLWGTFLLMAKHIWGACILRCFGHVGESLNQLTSFLLLVFFLDLGYKCAFGSELFLFFQQTLFTTYLAPDNLNASEMEHSLCAWPCPVTEQERSNNAWLYIRSSSSSVRGICLFLVLRKLAISPYLVFSHHMIDYLLWLLILFGTGASS